MANIYLPIELSRREVVGKMLLAGRLASRGHPTILFRSDLFDQIGWPAPGIYLGKNCFREAPPHELSFYRKMKREGVRVFYHDEEGGVYTGDSEPQWRNFLSRRVDLRALGSDDRVLAWGQWQAEHHRQQSLEASIHVTGHQNFEFFQPQFHHALEAFDRRQTSGEQGYILVNTRFVFANAKLETQGSHMIHAPTVRGFFDEWKIYEILANHGIGYFAFIRLVARLARSFPERRIIVRPHPAEKEEAYARVFEPLRNVRVTGQGDAGSWIRRCSVMIHNGCTTAIQSAIAQKPVITFMPEPEDPASTNCLPNRVGLVCECIDQVEQAIRSTEPCMDRGVWRRTISTLDTSKRVVSLVEDANERRAHLDLNRTKLKLFANHTLRKGVRAVLPGRRRAYRSSVQLFDEKFFAQGQALGGALRALYGDVRIEVLDPHCMAVLPPDPLHVSN